MSDQVQKTTLTVKDIQDILRIGQVSAYQLIHRPGFPVIKIGRSYRIPSDAFFKWMALQGCAVSER